MAVSGTYNFNLDIDEVIQEAMEMIGGEQTLGHEPASARRSINLMLKDWQNRGVLLWSTSVSSVTVAASTTAYDLASSTVDALEVVLNRDDTDLQLERISPEEYLGRLYSKGEQRSIVKRLRKEMFEQAMRDLQRL